MLNDSNILIGFLLTLGAGLATGIGSLAAFFARHTDRRFLSFSLGLSAGVMIYVSFVEILYHARVDMTSLVGPRHAETFVAIAFFGGMALSALIDKLVPSAENPHEMHSIEELDADRLPSDRKLARMGLFTAIAIAIHNFPEGIATFMSAVQEPKLGVAIAVAIAIHNIPEGIAVAVPIYFATRSRRKAFWYSFLSGLAEPLGATVAFLILLPFLTPMLLGLIFAAVAGIMIYISFDELLPASHEWGFYHIALYGVVAGMAIMALSLIMLA
ncbi:MAG: zinc transporter ZupT [Rikenellaceae bacterium]|jgi:ZIP family zinc transporter|nr:zinc transporter ZupT [Rikenellaceae bacterium]